MSSADPSTDTAWTHGPGLSTQLPAFDLGAALPTRTTVLEASAGTGKTYTVGALVARFVAEGTPLERILVVTFGRAASQELRERVRERLVEAAAALADPERNPTVLAADPLLAALARTGPAGRERLIRALADFDAATIATTHQFCQQVLDSLGVAGDSDPGAVLVENLTDLIDEVVDDLYVRRFAAGGADIPEISRDLAIRIGRQAVEHPDAVLVPDDAAPDSVAALRFRFATAVRAEVEKRKRHRGLLGYDDLLSRVAQALEAEDAPARVRMRARWSVVLVDEFQDTDPVQWDVVRRAFGGETIVLIGDPKQAIYAFRGGDVVTYLQAARTAARQATLDVNRRSDGPLVRALSVFFADAALGHDDIRVRPVRSAHDESRLQRHGFPLPAFRLRMMRRSLFGLGARAKIQVGPLRPAIAADLARDVVRLLGSGAEFDGRPIRAGDVAVLVNTHKQAELVRDALGRRRVPSVLAGAGSVYATPAAQDWQVLLEALEQPHRSGRVRAAALTPFVGLSAADLDAGGERLADELGALLRGWVDLLAGRGVAALLEVAATGPDLDGGFDRAGRRVGMPARLLARSGGERRLTDLRQIGENLQAVAAQEGLGLAAMIAWLRQRRTELAAEAPTDRLRRLDSDASAVKVMTVHVSKGLQFPVVYVPYAADQAKPPESDVLQLHDADGRRVLDVGGATGPGYGRRLRRAEEERAGEALRLLYVALTRAQSQVISWWAPSTTAGDSGLHRMLFGRQADGTIETTAAVFSDEDARARVEQVQAAGGPVVEWVGDDPEPPPLPAPDALPEMAVAPFDREIDVSWRRLSYSSLSAAGQVQAQQDRRPGVGSEPETGLRDDEALPESLPLNPERAPSWAQTPSLMADLPTGAAFGTVVHSVLEDVDPDADDLLAEVSQRCREATAATGISAPALAGALHEVLRTPLGPVADDLTLAAIARRDRLAELGFELPLAGGEMPTARVLLGAAAPLLRHHLPADDPLRPYADRLAAPEMAEQVVRGYLTGSLDLVVRLPGPRYVVADYKTNWLAPPDSTDDAGLMVWHYRPAALTAAMLHSDYPLQALLYGVALHRFLRWRQPGYDPEQHLGGVLYLYVRGMSGPDTPQVDGTPCGVFGWRPPAALTVALSDLLDGAGS